MILLQKHHMVQCVERTCTRYISNFKKVYRCERSWAVAISLQREDCNQFKVPRVVSKYWNNLLSYSDYKILMDFNTKMATNATDELNQVDDQPIPCIKDFSKIFRIQQAFTIGTNIG
ncbi:hypothetical protein SUGI_0919720 [Cryptomeria japonica]|nr:hypothetical protein SUGI_0919720 [Cryptomeria japonica]